MYEPTFNVSLSRVVVEFGNGKAFISSLDSEFQLELVRLVKQFGRPTKVEFRLGTEGWATNEE